MENVNFIRRNGRIIPIKQKSTESTSQQYENNLTKQDALVGFSQGLTQSLFRNNKKIMYAGFLGSAAHEVYTAAQRISTHGVGKGIWEHTKSSFGKFFASGLGVAVGTTARANLRHYAALRKPVKPADFSSYKLKTFNTTRVHKVAVKQNVKKYGESISPNIAVYKKLEK